MVKSSHASGPRNNLYCIIILLMLYKQSTMHVFGTLTTLRDLGAIEAAQQFRAALLEGSSSVSSTHFGWFKAVTSAPGHSMYTSGFVDTHIYIHTDTYT